MEEYNKEKSVVELPPIQPLETLSHESESVRDQSDKIKHSAEQSSANISSGLGSDDGTMVLPTVDDSTVSDDQYEKGAKKITVTDQPIAAQDSDRIEKIWVDKAKAIIKGSVGDPHKKSANLSTEKTQYRNARFNKLISNH